MSPKDPFDMLQESFGRLYDSHDKLVESHNKLNEKVHALDIVVAKNTVNIGHIVKFGSAILIAIISGLVTVIYQLLIKGAGGGNTP